MKIFKSLFPDDARVYQGSKMAFYGLILFTCLLIWRSTVHWLFWEFGLHTIANVIPIEGDPDPMRLIYMFFSVWGLEQVIRTFLVIVVLVKYRGLIPLILLVCSLEWWIRILHRYLDYFPSLDAQYTDGVTPGVVGAPFLGVILLMLFILSLRSKND